MAELQDAERARLAGGEALTDRDAAILAASGEGMTNRRIAEVLTEAGTGEVPPVTVSNPRVASVLKRLRK